MTNHIEESLQALSQWNEARTNESAGKKEGILKREGSGENSRLVWIPKPESGRLQKFAWHCSRFFGEMFWSWHDRGVESYLIQHRVELYRQARIRSGEYDQSNAVMKAFKRTLWGEGSWKTKKAMHEAFDEDAATHASCVARACSLQVELPEGIQKKSVFNLHPSDYREILQKNKYKKITLPENPTAEQEEFFREYNRVRDETLERRRENYSFKLAGTNGLHVRSFSFGQSTQADNRLVSSLIQRISKDTKYKERLTWPIVKQGKIDHVDGRDIAEVTEGELTLACLKDIYDDVHIAGDHRTYLLTNLKAIFEQLDFTRQQQWKDFGLPT